MNYPAASREVAEKSPSPFFKRGGNIPRPDFIVDTPFSKGEFELLILHMQQLTPQQAARNSFRLNSPVFSCEHNKAQKYNLEYRDARMLELS